MPDPTTYCTAAQVLEMAGRSSTDTKNATLIGEMEPRVRAIIDNETHNWFIPKSKTIYCKASTAYQDKLFMPAPVISITSVCEEESALGVDEYIIGPGGLWLELDGGYWSDQNYKSADGTLRYAIRVIGSFGCSTVPKDVEQAAAELCAVFAGLKTKTFITGEGIAQTVNLTNAPEYVRSILGIHTNRGNWARQPMRVTDTAVV